MRKTTYFVLMALAGMLVPSCQNNVPESIFETTAPGSPIESTLEETELDETLEAVDLLVEEAIDSHASLLRAGSVDSNLYLTDCPTISVDTLVKPHVMTIDFGSACTGKDGRVRSGKILVSATSFKVFPSVRTKAFQDFVVDNRQMEGTIVKTIQRDLVNNVRTATLQENVRIINLTKGDTLSRNSSITRQYKRNVLADKTDDQTLTWGTVSNTRPNGVITTKTISETTPLVFEAYCKHIVSGIASFENSKGRKWSINYGDGSCDNKATLESDGKTKEIDIR
jgi:hypothetical protein